MSTAQKESPTGAVGAGVGETRITEQNHAIVEDADALRKRSSTLTARAALTGHVLNKTSGGYILCRGSYSRHFIDLDTAEVLIRRMERGRP